MAPRRGERPGARRGGAPRDDFSNGAPRDGAKDSRSGGLASTTAAAAAMFLAGAVAERLLTRFIFRRHGKSTLRAGYCMMMAPPPGPAHSMELRLTHGLEAGAGTHHHQHPAPQHRPPTAPPPPPPVFDAAPEGFDAEDELLWNELLAWPDSGGGGEGLCHVSAAVAALDDFVPMVLEGAGGGWGLPAAPAAVRVVMPPPLAAAAAAAAAPSGLSPQSSGSAAAALQAQLQPQQQQQQLARPPLGSGVYAQGAPPAATGTPPAAATPPSASAHTTSERLRRAAFNVSVEQLRETIGLRPGCSKHAVISAAQVRFAKLTSELVERTAALAAALAAVQAGGGGGGGNAGPVGPACSADDSTDDAGGRGGSPAASDSADVPFDAGVTVQVEDHTGSGGSDAPLASLCFARVAGAARPGLLLDAAAALEMLPLALRHAAVTAPETGVTNMIFQLQVLQSAPPLRACEVRDALTAALGAAARRRASGVDVSASVTAALGMRAAPPGGATTADGKRRRVGM